MLEPLPPVALQRAKSIFDKRAVGLQLDELSMCSPSFLSHHSVRLCQITGLPDPFGGLPVLILGDFFQLKPVAAQSIYEGMLNYLSNDMALHQDNAYNHGLELFSKFRITILEGNNRSREDPIHAEIIHRLRD